MSEIAELERRITSAMDRIARGLEGLGTGGDAGEAAALRQALDDEKLVTAQLEERLRTLRQRQDEAAARLTAELEDARSTLARLDGEVQRLRKANAQLGENVARLREANAEGVAEPHLINKAMLAELEGLRAARAADVAEADAILSTLDNLLERPGQTEENAHA